MMSESIVNDTMSFKNDYHHLSLMEVMKTMYDARELVDVTICAEKKKFPCHRNVLAAMSPYFKAMFTSNLTEKHKSEVHMYEVDAEALGLIIQYAYTGELCISPDNAQNLLATASLLQITPIHAACARFMETQLDVSNCIGIYCFAITHSCTELKHRAQEHIEKNFTEVSQGDEFVHISKDKLVELLSSNELNVEKEEIVFEALLRWINHNELDRVRYLGQLLPIIRFSLLNSKYIQDKITNNSYIASSSQCLKLLEEVKDFENNPEHYHGEYTFSVILRSGMIKPEQCVLFIGGIDQNRPSINCYNALTREAYYMATFHDRDSLGYFEVEDPACIVTEDNQIFVAGGNYIFHETQPESASDEDSYDDYDEETVRKDFLQYDNDHDCWLQKTPMLFPKSNFSLASVHGQIFCFGGLTLNQHPTEIVEKYDIASNKWSYVGMMPTTLVDLATVVHNGRIYLLGGRTGVGAHNTVLGFDPKTYEWIHLAGMPTPRFKFGACIIDDEIYVAGGQIYSHTSSRINREALSSVEIYNIEQNQWRQGPNLPEEMYSVGLFLINKTLYACGTSEYYTPSHRMYRYNVVFKLTLGKTTWEQVETDLCDIRDYACVLAKMHTRKLSQLFRPEVDT